MFKFLSFVTAVYFYHKSSKGYLGGKDGGSITVVKNFSDAIDFEMEPADKLEEKTKRKRNTNKLPSMYYVISKPNSNMVMDNYTGLSRNGNPLILHPRNGSAAQNMKLNYVNNKSFVIAWSTYCFRYNQERNIFVTGSCTNLTKEDCLYIVERGKGGAGKRKAVYEETYNLDVDGSSKSNKISYHPNGQMVFKPPKLKVSKHQPTNKMILNPNDPDKNPDKTHDYNKMTNYGTKKYESGKNCPFKDKKHKHESGENSIETTKADKKLEEHFSSYHIGGNHDSHGEKEEKPVNFI